MKIGVGIITCDRHEFLKRSLASIPKADLVVIVNDGKPLDFDLSSYPIDFLVQHEQRFGVAKSKNDALELLLQEGCEHLFLIEDDILIKRSDIFEFYIRASQTSGILHFNFCLSSPMNIKRYALRYKNGVGMSFYRNLYQPFTYFRKKVIEKVGFYDTAYYNALEYVDHTYRIIQKGFHPPYYWFADPTGSEFYLETLDVGFKMSVVKEDIDAYRKNMLLGIEHFIQVHGVHPAKVVDTSRDGVKRLLGHFFRHSSEMVLTEGPS